MQLLNDVKPKKQHNHFFLYFFEERYVRCCITNFSSPVKFKSLYKQVLRTYILITQKVNTIASKNYLLSGQIESPLLLSPFLFCNKKFSFPRHSNSKHANIFETISLFSFETNQNGYFGSYAASPFKTYLCLEPLQREVCCKRIFIFIFLHSDLLSKTYFFVLHFPNFSMKEKIKKKRIAFFVLPIQNHLSFFLLAFLIQFSLSNLSMKEILLKKCMPFFRLFILIFR